MFYDYFGTNAFLASRMIGVSFAFCYISAIFMAFSIIAILRGCVAGATDFCG